MSSSGCTRFTVVVCVLSIILLACNQHRSAAGSLIQSINSNSGISSASSSSANSFMYYGDPPETFLLQLSLNSFAISTPHIRNSGYAVLCVNCDGSNTVELIKDDCSVERRQLSSSMSQDERRDLIDSQQEWAWNRMNGNGAFDKNDDGSFVITSSTKVLIQDLLKPDRLAKMFDIQNGQAKDFAFVGANQIRKLTKGRVTDWRVVTRYAKLLSIVYTNLTMKVMPQHCARQTDIATIDTIINTLEWQTNTNVRQVNEQFGHQMQAFNKQMQQMQQQLQRQLQNFPLSN